MTKMGSARLFPAGLVRRVRDRGLPRRGRLPLVVLLATSLVAVTAAVSGAIPGSPGLRFAQAGHWMASPALNLVVHVNAGARTVDAQVPVNGMDPDTQVVQGDTSGYVVGHSRITEFGKSNLSVEQTFTPPADERPVAVETRGGPYLVYRLAGSVVRLGDKPATIPAGRPLGVPVTTRDGTLWLQRQDTNVLCRLTPEADRVSCPAAAPVGHAGVLTVVGERAVFVDTDTDTLSPVADGGLGRPTRIGLDLSPTVQVAGVDVHGRVAVLDATARRMYLLDATGVGTDRVPGAPVTVALPDGDYSALSTSASSVVLLDRRRNVVLTYDGTGRPQGAATMPVETGEPRLSRGEDQRVYVEGAEGRHLMVVDQDGAVDVVPVIGTPAPTGSGSPAGTPVGPSRQPGSTPTGGTDRTPPGPGREPSGDGDGPDRPSQPTPERKPVPASAPGMPPGLRATPKDASLVVSWGAAPGNGATVSSYQVRWTPSGGSSTRSGGSRSMTITGLTRGTTYRITVTARNSAGTGTPATVRATLPLPPRTVTVSRGRATTYEDDCDAPDCAFMRVTMKGFEANTDYDIKPHSDLWPNYNPGTTLRTDGKGNLTFQDFPFDDVGQHVWVTVDGVESNHYLWGAG